MQTFTIIYTVLGGLGIFFYGMKSMSEALQSAAGDVIKNTISTITSNRYSSVVVGIIVTMIVQSSSVTTVMVVGFVNAGLMQLTSAIGVIFGANIGTTITGWIISIKIGKYGLLFIGMGIFPMLFGKTNRMRQIGRVMFGIGMIFFGLKIMSDGFKPLRTMPEFLEAISYFSGQHYGSYLASVAVGCLLTMIVQSSSAMLGITMALATTGVIQFHTAAALVLGENIGTTITAMLAAIGGNVNAKRTARAHAFFNLLGVVVMLCIFPYYIEFIEWFIPGEANFTENGEYPNIAVHIASGHSIFNITATILFLPFLKQLANFVIKITPDNNVQQEDHFIMLGEPKDIVPATALAAVREELKKQKEVVDKMYALTYELLNKEGQASSELLAKIRDYEQITDNIQKEITVYVIKLLQSPMSSSESKEAQAYMRLSDELESVADYLDRLSSYASKISLDDLFVGEAKADFFDFYKDVEEFYQDNSSHLDKYDAIDMTVVMRKSEQLRLKAEAIRSRHLERVSEGVYKPLTALTYSDMIVALRKIRSNTQNISEAYKKGLDS